MLALFTSFPAGGYAISKRFYEIALRIPIAREYEGKPHRFTNYDLGGMTSKVYEWLEPYHGSGHTGLFIETSELDGVLERVKKFGAKATDIVVHEWGGRCSTVTDPFGNMFTLIDSDQKGDI